MDPAFDPTAREAPLDKLERALIHEYLGVRGYDSVKLASLSSGADTASGRGLCLCISEAGRGGSAIARPR